MAATPLICSFDRFEDAQEARAQLLAEGLPSAAVTLRVIEDEAGPAEGNFVSGNGRRDATTSREAVITGGVIPYDRNFARTVSRGVFLLAIEVDDGAQRRRAQVVLERYAARDVAAVTHGA
jgi:hypothetical protein